MLLIFARGESIVPPPGPTPEERAWAEAVLTVAGSLGALERLRNDERPLPYCPPVALLNQYGNHAPEAPLRCRLGKAAYRVVAVLPRHRASPCGPPPVD
jgi:hypothetical protein